MGTVPDRRAEPLTGTPLDARRCTAPGRARLHCLASGTRKEARTAQTRAVIARMAAGISATDEAANVL